MARYVLSSVAAERQVLSEQASSSNKPPEVIEKMVTGRLQKVCLPVAATCMHMLRDIVSDVCHVARWFDHHLQPSAQRRPHTPEHSECMCLLVSTRGMHLLPENVQECKSWVTQASI